jgi:hypothetical protein
MLLLYVMNLRFAGGVFQAPVVAMFMTSQNNLTPVNAVIGINT